MNDAKQCPWCGRWCLKDAACNYIFACGLETRGKFMIGAGCGRPWCWHCEKKFCGQYINPMTGQKTGSLDSHNATCCSKESGYTKETYCSGGHNSHCEPR